MRPSLACLSMLLSAVLASPTPEQIPFQLPYEHEALANKTLVPVTLGVMSRCPDAHACEALLDRTFQSQSSQGIIRSLVEPDLLFIGSLNKTTRPYGVDCKHGAAECRGNVQELCMMEAHDWTVWWPFVQCLRWSGSRIGDDSLARQCASLVKVDWDQLQSCVDGSQGAKLLQASVRKADKQHIDTSCSILINDQLVCMRDDGKWKQCDGGHDVSDLAAQIARAYDALN